MATSKTTLDKNISMGRSATASVVPDKNISMGRSDSASANSAEDIINPPTSDDTDQAEPAQS